MPASWPTFQMPLALGAGVEVPRAAADALYVALDKLRKPGQVVPGAIGG